MTRHAVLIAAAAILLCRAALASTPVNGVVTTTVWTQMSSPYRVTGGITVPSGETLAIEPGVEVLFDADVEFTVLGSLVVGGTEEDSVRFTSGTALKWGGIQFRESASGTLHYVRISHASQPYGLSGSGGGAILVDHSVVDLVHCDIVDNGCRGGDLTRSGGGILGRNESRISLTNCRVADNHATRGGGIALDRRTRVLCVSSEIENNTSEGAGGGILCIEPNLPLWEPPWDTVTTLRLQDCVIRRNAAQGFGGGLSVRGGNAIVARCRISENSASRGGGVYARRIGFDRMTMSDCTIDANVASGGHYGSAGAGIAAERIPLELSNCILSGNSAGGAGGAIVTRFAPLTLTKCTVAGNVSDGEGGGIVISQGGDLNLNSSVLWDNNPNSIAYVGGDNIVQFAQVTYDPLAEQFAVHLDTLELDLVNRTFEWYLETLRDWGIPPQIGVAHSVVEGGFYDFVDDTSALFVDPGGGNYRLAQNSDLVDMGDPALPLDDDGTRANIGATPAHRVEHADVPLSPAVGRSHADGYVLHQNTPNPFNPTTTIRYDLLQEGSVRLGIYDINGRVVRMLVNGQVAEGQRQIDWDGTDAAGRPAASGVYVYRLESSLGVYVRRMTLLR